MLKVLQKYKNPYKDFISLLFFSTAQGSRDKAVPNLDQSNAARYGFELISENMATCLDIIADLWP